MMYDDYGNEKKEENRNTGYANVGSSGTNTANTYEEAGTGHTGGYRNESTGTYRNPGQGSYNGQYGYESRYGSSQGRPHYTSYQDATYREPVRNNGTSEQPKQKKPQGKKRSFWKKAVAAIVVGVLLGGSAAGAFYGVYRLTGMDEAVATIAGAKEAADNATRTAATVAQDSGTVKTQPTTAATDAPADETADATTGVSKVVENVMPAVVAITNSVTVTGQTWWGQTIERTGEAAGSGIIVGENDDELLIVTNQHVISDATSLSVQFVDGNTAEANLK